MFKKNNTNNLINFIPNIGECLNTSNRVIDKFNHASVYVETNVSDFILDPTNLCEIEIIKNKEIYCPTGEYVVNMNFFKKNQIFIQKFHQYIFFSPYQQVL